MIETLDKVPIQFFEKHMIKYDKRNNLEVIVTLFPYLDKWIANKDIDKKLSNDN